MAQPSSYQTFASVLPPSVTQLTEETSIELARSIQCLPVMTPLSHEPIQTTYVRRGQTGTPILLLHGFDSSVMEFRRLLPQLTTPRETWAVDLLGFGFTDRPEDVAFTPQTVKTHLYHFWRQEIDRPVVLVGASMGGAVAIDFALTYPEAVHQLVFLDSAGFARPSAATKMMVAPLGLLAAEFLRNQWVRDRISRLAYCDKRYASRDASICAAMHLSCPRWREATIEFAKSGGYTFLADRIAQLEAETLIIWGTEDRILGTDDAMRFQEAISHNKLIWIPDCGHVPHLEKPEMTASHILSFMC